MDLLMSMKSLTIEHLYMLTHTLGRNNHLTRTKVGISNLPLGIQIKFKEAAVKEEFLTETVVISVLRTSPTSHLIDHRITTKDLPVLVHRNPISSKEVNL